MSDENVSNLPVGDVDFDFDTIEQDPKDVKPPFRATIAGRLLTATSPDDMDWQDTVLIENPVEILEFVMSKEDRRHLKDQNVPNWKLAKFMEAYSIHFGLDDRMRQAQREQRLASVGR